MSVADRIQKKLEAAFAPLSLSIIDESAQHAGHAGSRSDGESHFRLAIVSSAFAGKSRIDRQRMVHEVLAEELRNRVHALSLKLDAPEG